MVVLCQVHWSVLLLICQTRKCRTGLGLIPGFPLSPLPEYRRELSVVYFFSTEIITYSGVQMQIQIWWGLIKAWCREGWC